MHQYGKPFSTETCYHMRPYEYGPCELACIWNDVYFVDLFDKSMAAATMRKKELHKSNRAKRIQLTEIDLRKTKYPKHQDLESTLNSFLRIIF